MANKLFGNSSGSRFTGDTSASGCPAFGTKKAAAARDGARKARTDEKEPDTHEKKVTKEPKSAAKTAAVSHNPKSRRARLKPLKVILIVLLVLEVLYCVAIFSNIPFIARLRTTYIKTAMSTMSHQWLATAFIPKDIVDDVVRRTEDARLEQVGNNSSWADLTEAPTEAPIAPTDSAEATEPKPTEEAAPSAEQLAFFELFYELDQSSTLSYVKKHPDALSNGWEKLYINEAGLKDDGTTIKTLQGDQVLAIDAENQVLLIRVTDSTYRGILAICKDPAMLSLELSKNFGVSGQRAGDIAERHNGIVAITASGFIDNEGTGNGGTATGLCVSNGESYGKHFGSWGYKRIELREDNRMYVVDAPSKTHKDTTDAAEFWPALVVDGKNALGRDNIFTELNPRACIGQNKKEEIMMLVIEGRMLTSLGATAEDCNDVLLRYDCYQAMNMDGGTSAIMWFDGEYVTRCSNSALSEGRRLPNAWVYKKASE